MDSGSPCRVLGADDVDTPGLGVRSGVLAPGQKVALQPSRNNSTPDASQSKFFALLSR